MISSHEFMIILYVSHLEQATEFYRTLLNCEPCLETTGMVEIPMTDSTKLGLMSSDGFHRLMAGQVNHPNQCKEAPRCELYLTVDDPSRYFNHAISLGAIPLSETALRDWGSFVSYVQDEDGNVIAFASRGLCEG
jgi:catechol 2,3-dioxygenase-like lactoylglutathione lyase family enzyme